MINKKKWELFKWSTSLRRSTGARSGYLSLQFMNIVTLTHSGGKFKQQKLKTKTKSKVS